MGRLWGVLWGVSSAYALALADVPHNRLRAPNGMLWAGTTFQLRASASTGNQLLALSSEAQVRVGQVVRWRWQLESPSGQSIRQGHAVFGVRLLNDGNGWDRLGFALASYELTASPSWTVELRENRSGDGDFWRSAPVNGVGSVIEPGGDMLYLVRMQPPSGGTPTDGAWSILQATASNGSQQVLGEFVAGVVRLDWVRARAWCYGSHTQFVAPVLHQGRLFWMGTDPARSETLVFYTRDAVEATAPNGDLLGNQRLEGRTLNNFIPTGFSVVLGNGWFTGRGNQLVRLDITRVQERSGAGDPFVVVQFPQGVSPRLDLEPLVFNGRLYVAASDGRLHAICEDGIRAGQSAPLPSTYGAFSTNLVLMGRTFYVGTQNGWIAQIDAVTGNLRATRRVSATQPIYSLAPTPFGRILLARVGNRELVALNPNQLLPLWRRTLSEELVSPVVASHEREVGAVVTRSGALYAFHARAGTPLAHYPQPIFGEGATL